MGTWVLENKHGSSAWIACAPNHWSIFPAPPGISLHMLCFMICRSGREWFLERTREIFLCQLVSFFLKKKKEEVTFTCVCLCVCACLCVCERCVCVKGTLVAVRGQSGGAVFLLLPHWSERSLNANLQPWQQEPLFSGPRGPNLF